MSNRRIRVGFIVEAASGRLSNHSLSTGLTGALPYELGAVAPAGRFQPMGSIRVFSPDQRDALRSSYAPAERTCRSSATRRNASSLRDFPQPSETWFHMSAKHPLDAQFVSANPVNGPRVHQPQRQRKVQRELSHQLSVSIKHIELSATR